MNLFSSQIVNKMTRDFFHFSLIQQHLNEFSFLPPIPFHLPCSFTLLASSEVNTRSYFEWRERVRRLEKWKFESCWRLYETVCHMVPHQLHVMIAELANVKSISLQNKFHFIKTSRCKSVRLILERKWRCATRHDKREKTFSFLRMW